MRICEQNGWEYEIFEEIASGDSDKQELNKILTNIEKYDGILVMDIDRLSRNEIESLTIKALLIENKVQVITPTGVLNHADEGVSMMYSFKAIFADVEHKKIKARMKAGKINRFKNGEYVIGKPPLGYKIENKHLVIDEESAQIVRKIFELSVQGHGRVAVEDATGVGHSNVRHILQNRSYIGQVEYQVGEEEYTHACPAIIDVELFVKAQEEVKRRYKAPVKTRGEIGSIVQGLARCGQCGCQMSITKNRILRCGKPKCKQRSIKLSVVEDFILNHIDEQSDVLSGILWDRMEETNTSPRLGNEIADVRSQLQAMESKLERVKDMYLEGDIDKTEYKERGDKIKSDVRKL